MIKYCNHQTTFNNGYQRKDTYQKLHTARIRLRISLLIKGLVFWNFMTRSLLYLYLHDIQREEGK